MRIETANHHPNFLFVTYHASVNPSIVTIGTMKTVKTFFFPFPALNSITMSKKLKYSNSYLIVARFLLSVWVVRGAVQVVIKIKIKIKKVRMEVRCKVVRVWQLSEF